MHVAAIDMETLPFRQACMAPPPVCASVAEAEVDDESVKAYATEAALWQAEDFGLDVRLLHAQDPQTYIELHDLWAAAADPFGDVVLIGHHMAFDVVVKLAQWPELTELVFAAYEAGHVSDTIIRQKLLDIADGCYRGWTDGVTGKHTKYAYYLDDLTERLLKRRLDKNSPWRMRYESLLDVPLEEWPEGARRYALDDGGATLGVWIIQEARRLRDPVVLEDEARQVRAALALQLASVWGIRTDKAGVQALHDEAQGEIDRLTELLVRESLLRRNGSRIIKNAQKRMFAANPRGRKTPTGKPALDEESCLSSGDPALIALSQYGQAQNILSKDVKALARGVRLPIHTRFDSLMETGRTSSSGEYNLQNPRRKRGVRECFVPREGMLYAACDYEKAELHTLSQVCIKVLGRSRLAERLNGGFDPHLDLGSQIVGVSYEEAFARRGEKEIQDARQHAKPANFAFGGGMGVKGFQIYAKSAYGVDFTRDFCKSLREKWLETWPEMPDYFEWIRNLCGQAGVATIEHLFSRRRRGLVPYTVACNSFFQGLCADGAKSALWEVCRRQYAEPSNPLWGCRTVNFLHDELVIEVPEERAHEAAMELQRVMIEAFNPWVPDVPIRASVSLMRRWSKSAEPAWLSNQLIPWEDAT